MNFRYYKGFSPKKTIATLACPLLFIVISNGCTDSSKTPSKVDVDSSTSPAKMSLKSLMDRISEAGEALAPHAESIEETTKQEVTKLFRWEYKLLELPSESSAEEIEQELNRLGHDNWDCSPVPQAPPQRIRMHCKRRPRSPLSYLRYVP